MARPTWEQLDTRRAQLGRRLSRAELARRAGLSESTIAKGIRHNRTPQTEVRKQVELILEAEEKMVEAGL